MLKFICSSNILINMVTPELTLAYVGLVLVMVTWGLDKTEWLDGRSGLKSLKQKLGLIYIILGIIIAAIYTFLVSK